MFSCTEKKGLEKQHYSENNVIEAYFVGCGVGREVGWAVGRAVGWDVG
jgi:hypothetical protein